MEIISYLTNIKDDINDIAEGKISNSNSLLKSLSAQLEAVIEHLQNTSSNSEYKQCEYCHGTKILCIGAGQCDHDGSEWNLISNCGEYVPEPCKYCNN